MAGLVTLVGVTFLCRRSESLKHQITSCHIPHNPEMTQSRSLLRVGRSHIAKGAGRIAERLEIGDTQAVGHAQGEVGPGLRAMFDA